MSGMVSLETAGAAGPLADAAPPERRAFVRTRIAALAALLAVVVVLARGGISAYWALTDAFVAPIILSPDNDTVVQNKLSFSRIVAERQAVAARIDEHHAAIDAAQRAVLLLDDLQRSASGPLQWATAVAGGQAALGEGSIVSLERQRQELSALLARQEKYVAELEKDLRAGLIRRTDLEREETVLHQTRAALLQNDRERLAARTQLDTASLAQRALTSRGAARIATPEMIAQRDQLVRIQVEILQHEAEKRTRLAQQRADEEALARLDELIAQMRERPIFRAADSRQNVAFVPYQQIEGVRAGAAVYRCALWGVLGCDRVGTVAELLPGEVVMQDPWGTPARGQYATLELLDLVAAQAKTLRIRDAGHAKAATAQAKVATARSAEGLR